MDPFDASAFVAALIESSLDEYCAPPRSPSPLLLQRDLPIAPDILADASPSAAFPDLSIESFVALIVDASVEEYCGGESATPSSSVEGFPKVSDSPPSSPAPAGQPRVRLMVARVSPRSDAAPEAMPLGSSSSAEEVGAAQGGDDQLLGTPQ
jgi:hypothetical protein